MHGPSHSDQSRSTDDRGFTIVEAMVALGVLALVAVGFGTAMGQGLDLLGSSNRRQTATQLASQWQEEARSVPYAALSLRSDTTYETDSTSPDAAVVTAGDVHTYDASAGSESGAETIIEDLTDGLVHHEHETINGTDFGIYRYITWVASGAEPEAYKRSTVVVSWSGTSATGNPNRVTLSTIVGPTGISFETAGGSTTTTTTPSTTTTTTPSTTTTTSACPSDSAGPVGSVTILAGTGANTGYTNSSTVALSLTASDTCTPVTMQFSNDAGATWSAAVAFNTAYTWTLTAGEGDRTVRVRFLDGVGNATTASASTRVDSTKPTTPGSFTATVKTGPKRVQLTWTASTDNDVLVGYRIYRALGQASFQNQATGVSAPCGSSPCTWTDSGVQNNKTYSYYVVAYDAAGNESSATATITKTI